MVARTLSLTLTLHGTVQPPVLEEGLTLTLTLTLAPTLP